MKTLAAIVAALALTACAYDPLAPTYAGPQRDILADTLAAQRQPIPAPAPPVWPLGAMYPARR